jgi:hypothetical protein
VELQSTDDRHVWGPGKAPRFADCPEDCPRCNRCPPSDLRRMIIDALIIATELEKERYEADGLQSLLPPMDWHELVLQALDK